MEPISIGAIICPFLDVWQPLRPYFFPDGQSLPRMSVFLASAAGWLRGPGCLRWRSVMSARPAQYGGCLFAAPKFRRTGLPRCPAVGLRMGRLNFLMRRGACHPDSDRGRATNAVIGCVVSVIRSGVLHLKCYLRLKFVRRFSHRCCCPSGFSGTRENWTICEVLLTSRSGRFFRKFTALSFCYFLTKEAMKQPG